MGTTVMKVLGGVSFWFLLAGLIVVPLIWNVRPNQDALATILDIRRDSPFQNMPVTRVLVLVHPHQSHAVDVIVRPPDGWKVLDVHSYTELQPAQFQEDGKLTNEWALVETKDHSTIRVFIYLVAESEDAKPIESLNVTVRAFCAAEQ